MTINFSQKFVTLGGDTVPDGDKGGVLTLRTIAENALLGTFQDDTATGEEKLKRWKLAQSIHSVEVGTLNVTSEDVVLIKRLIAKAYATMIVGQAYEMLEGESA